MKLLSTSLLHCVIDRAAVDDGAAAGADDDNECLQLTSKFSIELRTQTTHSKQNI